MKRTSLFLLLIVAAAAASAQPALSRGNENKYFDAGRLAEALYAGQYGNHDCWLTDGKRKTKMVVVTNANMWPQQEYVYAKGDGIEVLEAAVEGDYCQVMVADRSEKRRTTVGCYRVRLTDGAVEAGRMDTLVSFAYGKKDLCQVWHAMSPDGSKIALLAVVQYAESEAYRTYIAVYDRSMDLVWKGEYPLVTLDQICVGNDGRIVTLGTDDNGEQAIFSFSTLSRDGSMTEHAIVNSAPVHKLHLLGISGGHALAVGDYGLTGGRRVAGISGGTVVLSYSVDSATLTRLNMRPFQNEDVNIFYNKKTKKVQKDMVCDHYDLLSSTVTDYGYAALMGRAYRLDYESASGQSESDYHCVGLQLLAIDSLGNIRWVRNMRRNDMQKGSADMLAAEAVVANGKTAVVKCEHPKYPLIYDIAKEVKEFQAGDKGNLVIYSFDDEGNSEKLIVEKGTKQSLVRAMMRPDGSLVMLTGRGNRTRLAELKYKY